MSNLKRHQQIMEQLIQTGEVKVIELSAQLSVTGKTIRADLEELEQQGLLKRVHGGAVLMNSSDLGMLPLHKPNQQHLAEKTAIAKRAVSLIEDEDIVALDGGSTTLEIARLLEDKPYTVITNDLFIIAELIRKANIRLVVPGGYRNRNLLVGADSIPYITRLNIQKAFITATAVHPEQGMSIYTSELYDLKRAYIETAKASYAVADSSKFGKTALITFAQLNEMKGIITDTHLQVQERLSYKEHGAKLLFAE